MTLSFMKGKKNGGRFLWRAILVLCSLSFQDNVVVSSSSYKNIYGKKLQSCSQDGMARTGYTRSGYCVDQNDDSGSHHICIDLSSLAGDNDDDASNQNFCDVTGQSDWCSSEMPCHDDEDNYCPVEQWCVCQWAFATYLQNAGGCDQIQDIVCESINMVALKAYAAKNGEKKYDNAFDCITSRCDVGSAMIASYYFSSSAGRITKDPFFWLTSCTIVLCVVIFLLYKRRQQLSLNDPALKQHFVALDGGYGGTNSNKEKIESKTVA